MFDGSMVDGNHYLLRTRWLPATVADAAEVLIDAAAAISSPYSALAVHHFHGAATRVAARPRHGVRACAPTTCSSRSSRSGRPADRPGRTATGPTAPRAGSTPHALPGGYPNLLGPDETDRVRLAYGGNLDRLIAGQAPLRPA